MKIEKTKMHAMKTMMMTLTMMMTTQIRKKQTL